MRISHALLDIATLPLTFVWWTLAYRYGLCRPSRPRATVGSHQIQSFEHEPFEKLFARGEPAVLTGVGRVWRAFSWTPTQLAAELGSREVTVNITPAADRDFLQSFFDQTTTQMAFGQVIALVFGGGTTGFRYYVMGGGWNFLGALAGDIDAPEEVSGRRFFPPASGLWVGQQGNITALHYDIWHGFHGQIVGRKRVIMFAPRDSRNVYPTGPFATRLAATHLPTACHTADPHSFPRLGRADRYEVVLKPGELLYIPPFWWHYVESLDNVISIALRYDPLWRETLHPGSFPVKYRTVLRPIMTKLGKALRGSRSAAGSKSMRESSHT